jgi:bifunctional non-homologous end joining protein LigD
MPFMPRATSSKTRSARPSSSSDPLIAGIRISHPARIIFPDAGLAKIDLIRYYDSAARWMLPHLEGRPLTLKQCAPDADHCRYLRHSGERAPAHVRVVKIQEKTKVGDYMIVDDEAGLISLAQRNIVEFHTWNTTADRLEQPDRIVLDLDPGPDVAWPKMVAAARLVRSTLESQGLRSWLKTTGGKGLHVVAPLVPAADWTACLEFARSVAFSIAEHEPRLYTTRFAKAGRESQILIDYLRNNRTNTAVAAYSVRARSHAPISVPLDWDELTPRLDPGRWTVKTIGRRFKALEAGHDPWAEYFRCRQKLRSKKRT